MSNFEEPLHSISKVDVNVCKERILAFCNQLMSVISPSMKDLPENESTKCY